MRLQGKAGIVTGAAKGIGKAIASLFVQHGARVVLVDVDAGALERTAAELKGGPGEAVPFAGDLGRPEVAQAVAALAMDRFGRLDFLVNNAAWYVVAPLVETADEDWDETIRNALTSVFLMCKAVLPHMVRQGQGAIVNIASINQIVANPHHAAYTAAKGGVRGLTKQIAIEYGPHGIRCNCISPGLILTERIRETLTPADERLIREAYPIGRLGRVDDVAYAALYLVSDESGFVTGVDLPVDGGLTSLSPGALVSPALRRRWGRPPIRIAGEEAVE
ncbi:MAG TPA: SDR family NAD(P)-dependent oxidoreductase [Limnochordales bacterium]